MTQVINPSPYNVNNVSILTGEPNTWLLIYSGIVDQKLDAQGNTGFLGIGQSTSETDATVNVTLDNISGVLLQYATQVSPSNFLEENTWGQWIIWGSSLSLRDNGDLVLTASTSVTGIGDAEFYSFSYYVSVKVVVDLATISGTITWPRSLATPRSGSLFNVTANSLIASSGSSFGQFQVVANGVLGELDTSDETEFQQPYTISGPLLGKTLFVFAAPNQNNFTVVPASDFLVTTQISGPNPIRLTSSNRHAANVNFEMTGQAPPQ